MCRSAGYYEHAVFLADKHDQHDSYLKTQLEDLHNYKKALEYIGRLDFEEVSLAASCVMLIFLQIKKRTFWEKQLNSLFNVIMIWGPIFKTS